MQVLSLPLHQRTFCNLVRLVAVRRRFLGGLRGLLSLLLSTLFVGRGTLRFSRHDRIPCECSVMHVGFVGFGLPGAVITTEDVTVDFDAVADHLAAAMGAIRSQFLNRTFEAIVGVFLVAHDDREGVFVVVSALMANGHDGFLSPV
jgi:hypothetical protein